VAGTKWGDLGDSMARLSAALLLTFATTVSVGGQRPTFRAGVDLIVVDANVVDARGRPVGDLGLEEFTLTIDGKPRRPVSAEFVSLASRPAAPPAQGAPPSSRYYSTNEKGSTAAGGRLFLIVVDQENIGIGGGKAAMAAAGGFLDRLTPADRVGLATIPRGGPNVEFTNNPARIREAFGRVVGRGFTYRPYSTISPSEAFTFVAGNQVGWDAVVQRECEARTMIRALLAPGTAPEVSACRIGVENEARQIVEETLQRTRDSVTALRALVASLGQLNGPKTLVLVSEGLIVGAEPRYMGEFAAEASAVAEAAAHAGVIIYVLRLDRTSADYDASRRYAPPTAAADAALSVSGLETIAGAARGTIFTVVGRGDTAFERLALETSGYYLLGVEPLESDRDGKSHKVAVTVGRKGLTVRARREFSITVGGADRRASPDEEVAAMLRSAQPATEVPLRVSSYTLRDQQKSKLRLIITADIDRDRAEPAEYTVGLVLRDRQDRLPASSIERKALSPLDPSHPGPVVYTVAETVDPGSYTLKLAVVDGTGRRGSVEHPIEARLTSSDGLEVSDLLIAERSSLADGGWRPAIEAVVRDALNAYLEVYSADRRRLKQTSVSFEVAADEKSPALASVTSKPQDTKEADRSTVEGSVSLNLLPPGDYLARAVVSLSGRPVTRTFRPIRIDRAATALAAGLNRPVGSTASAIVGASAVEPFRRELVLEAETVGHFLDRLASLSATPPSASVSKAIGEARAGRFDAAFDALKGAGPDDLGAAFVRGLALLWGGKLEEAANQFRASLRISSEFIPAIVYLGACYAVGGHDRDAAGAWQTSLLTESDTPVVYRLLGDALLRLGDGEQAREILLEATSTWPDDESLKRLLAAAYVVTGQEKEALAALEPYLARHRDDQRALFLAVGLIYAAYEEGRTIEGPGQDGARISRYAQSYAAAGGPRQQLVAQWVRFVEERK
jgi:VWFA-related protein